LLELERESFPREAFPAAYFMELDSRAGAQFLVATAAAATQARHDLVIGYAIAAPCSRSGAELVSIAVAAAARHRGLGRRLLSAVLRKLRGSGVDVVTLTVRADNTGPQCLYRSFGFVATGLVRRYYGDGADGIRMRLKLAR
jgi:[ribosomal protein S18]-alanine N-acetyltransferase